MTIEQLIEQLQYLTIHGPSDAQVIINGERVETISIELQNPISDVGSREGWRVLVRDKSRSQVVSIAVNDRKHERLPVMRYGGLAGNEKVGYWGGGI